MGERGLGKRPPCGLRTEFSAAWDSGQHLLRDSAWEARAASGCSIGRWCGPWYFNHETCDKQAIMWFYTFTCAIYLNSLFQGFSFTVWTSIFSHPLPKMTKLHHFPHPLGFPTPQILKQPTATKPLILVCYLMVKYCRDTKLDIYYIFDVSKCQWKLHVFILFVCFSLCCFYGKQQSSHCPECVKCSFITWDLLSFSRCGRVW